MYLCESVSFRHSGTPSPSKACSRARMCESACLCTMLPLHTSAMGVMRMSGVLRLVRARRVAQDLVALFHDVCLGGCTAGEDVSLPNVDYLYVQLLEDAVLLGLRLLEMLLRVRADMQHLVADAVRQEVMRAGDALRVRTALALAADHGQRGYGVAGNKKPHQRVELLALHLGRDRVVMASPAIYFLGSTICEFIRNTIIKIFSPKIERNTF